MPATISHITKTRIAHIGILFLRVLLHIFNCCWSPADTCVYLRYLNSFKKLSVQKISLKNINMNLNVYSVLHSGFYIKTQFKTHFNHLYQLQNVNVNVRVFGWSLCWKCFISLRDVSWLLWLFLGYGAHFYEPQHKTLAAIQLIQVSLINHLCLWFCEKLTTIKSQIKIFTF